MADTIDYQIAELINSYIVKARNSGAKEGVDVVESAFGMIKQDRQEKCLSDQTYSSAEHYLTARCLSAVLTGGVMAIASVVYDGAKLIGGSKNVQRIGLGNACPASELTGRQTQWKLFGCVHGSRDLIMRGRKINPVNATYLESGVLVGIGGD